ncbi:hypothetical protein [Singulisphaera acidiphila]|uniref:Uncharacterized protein n=1 Tax=Singulisphaera acidiphila (strain ATCC BAA-1392 / DSM 18658 / VKM B-2454 / MOB10) TaxID=886293 RepID=L0DKT4_SINAD|nr:hypothetical protein [Singulisphaera acidiphila]AGA29276.1 hypothetical protein Sinac_5124 [Singulisphaera acidiphila DSM 18658]
MIFRRTRVVLLVSTALVSVSAAWLQGADEPEEKIRDGFETPRPVWRQEQTDATINLQEHERSNRAAHSGQTSERFHFTAGVGSSFFYSYPLPQVVVRENLKVELFVRSNRVGVRLYGRVVLPKDIDPNTGQPSFVMIPGTGYENNDRWQRIELTGLSPSIERQARVLRAATRRPVDVQGAYLERVVVNLFGGEGETEVFLDDLEISPVSPEALAAFSKPEAPSPSLPAPASNPETPKSTSSSTARVKLDGMNKLLRRGPDNRDYDWFVTAISAPDADVAQISHHGFDVLAEKVDAEPDRIKEALKWGLQLMLDLDATLEGKPIEPDRMFAAANNSPFRDQVAFWNLGNHLGRAIDPEARKLELERIRAAGAALRGLPQDVSHLTTAGVDGELPLFANGPKRLSIMTISPNAWGSAQEPIDTYRFLKQRRDLTALDNPDGLFFAWLPASPPLSVQASIWGRDQPPSWGTPRVQPEQLRLFTYLALAAGYRGIGFRGDAGLTTDEGRATLIEMAFLNMEIDLCESILANAKGSIPLYDTFDPDPPILPPLGSSPTLKVVKTKEMRPHPSIKAAGIGTLDHKGTLLLVTDFAGGAQFQPSQMAKHNLNITIQAPESAQAFEISPGDVKAIDMRQRVPGGVRITLPDFGLTSLILVTTDHGMADRLLNAISGVRPRACQLAIEQARIQLRLVEETTNRLIADGHTLYNPNDPKIPRLPVGARPPNEEEKLLKLADSMIKTAQENFERMDYPLAWSEARRAGRTLRHLMFAQWSKAYGEMSKLVAPEPPKPAPTRRGRMTVDELKAEQEAARNRTPMLLMPLASPPLVSYYTLPQHYIWLDWMARSFGANLVKGGSFDNHATLESAGWINQSYQIDGITSKILSVASEDEPGQRFLKMSVEPTDKRQLDSFAPFFDFPAAAIQTPPIRVTAGQFLRISVLVQKMNPSAAGQGGLIITDSIGGEALQFRNAGSIPKFSKVVLFRRVPADGVMTVTLGLAGFGEAYFDDLKVETVEGSAPGPLDQYADNPVKRTIPGSKPAAPATGAPAPATAAGKRGVRRSPVRR